MKAAASRPSSRRDPVRFRSLAVLLIPSVLLVTVFAIRQFQHSAAAARTPISTLASNWQSAVDFHAPVDSRRPIFPYSVVPGGVADQRELTAAVAKDPVVAAHYADFRLDQAHTIRLERDREMYVSYRLDDRVYWTRHPMRIAAGETLISDGENLARVRCGNRLSTIAAKPVSLAEPSSEELETPRFFPPLLADGAPGEGAEPLGAVALPALPLLPPGSGLVPGTIPVVFPPLLAPGPGHSFVPPPGLPVPPPPVSTPEPAGIELLAAGALLFAAGVLLRK